MYIYGMMIGKNVVDYITIHRSLCKLKYLDVVVDNHIAVLFLKVKEEPLKDKDRHTYQVQSTYRHVSGRGREQIDVILHGASSLPDTESGTTPQAFVIVQVFTLTI